ncbi:hypothetical protein [Lederbergia citrea]|uniref:hypothetical protein n=1 Tax=Lederbergia citrea TaxID=2833581 RepID=UPI001BC9D6D0|nr:hypothetical protein [Lederbergia citrea]MBS4179538.1 hypothetical protein [Lederbergia citrea]MBS4206206.1 hypothetical protein [Lederbergia citrea]
MGALKEQSRYDLLLAQFQYSDLYLNEKTKQSLERIRTFLYEETDVHYLVFIRQETLIQYLQYHRSKKFNRISFIQAINDIKIFLFFLKSKKEITSIPKIDLSLQNLNLWINL